MNTYDRKELERLEAKAKNLDTRVTRLEADVINIWKEINDLWSIVIEILKDIELLKVRVSDLEDRMDIAEKEIDQLFQEITYIWGDPSMRANHNKYNIKKIWEKLTELENRIAILEEDTDQIKTEIENLKKSIADILALINDLQLQLDNLANIVNKLGLEDPNKAFLVVGRKEYSFEDGGTTYRIEGAYAKLKDPNNGLRLTIQVCKNLPPYDWPGGGLYFPLPTSWDIAGFAISASDMALLHENDCRPLGTCFGRYDGSNVVDIKTHVGVKPGGDGSLISWNLIAIGI